MGNVGSMTEEEIFRRYGHQFVIPIPHGLEWVIKAVATAPPVELASLDKRVRETLPYRQPETEWLKIGPEELEALLRSASSSTEILGLASFHPSGYIRELAVRRLVQIRSGAELPFLLLRLNDWVAPLSHLALSAVQERVTPQYAGAFIQNILLVFNLAEQKRHQHGPVLSAVMNLLKRPECDGALQHGLVSLEKQVRRLCFRILREADDGRLLGTVPQMLADADPALRLAAARSARVTLSDDALDALLPLMKRDSFLPVRREALYACLERLPELAPAELREALLDSSAAMRGIARYHLRQAGTFDMPDFYRQALAASPVASIDGLGETGTEQDVRWLLPYLSHPRAKIRRAAVRAVSRLDGDNQVEALLAALIDDRPSVVHEAREALRPRLSLLREGALWRLFKADARLHVRRDILALLASLPKWESVPFLVEAAVDEDPVVQEVAGKRLRGWYSGYNSSFVRPTQAQIMRLEEALRINPGTGLETLVNDWKVKNKT